jgi:thiosulfate dehydrogenase
VKPFFIGMIVGWIVLPVMAFLYLRFGYVPVAVNGPVIPFEELLAGAAVQARIAREAPAKAAFSASEQNLIEGAKIYRERCVECHGLPGGTPSAISLGMYPPPPQFFDRKVMGNEPVGQDYWIVANGIRLTGMPAYRQALSEEQLWQVGQFVANRDKLPPGATAILTAPATR